MWKLERDLGLWEVWQAAQVLWLQNEPIQEIRRASTLSWLHQLDYIWRWKQIIRLQFHWQLYTFLSEIQNQNRLLEKLSSRMHLNGDLVYGETKIMAHRWQRQQDKAVEFPSGSQGWRGTPNHRDSLWWDHWYCWGSEPKVRSDLLNGQNHCAFWYCASGTFENYHRWPSKRHQTSKV